MPTNILKSSAQTPGVVITVENEVLGEKPIVTSP